MASTGPIPIVLQLFGPFGYRHLQTTSSGIAIGSIYCTPFCRVLVVRVRWICSFWPKCLLHNSRKHSEIESSKLDGSWYTSGFGTGLLAAAAVSCFSTFERFLPIALDTALVSFRVGLLAAEIRDQIVTDKENLACWRVRVETDKPEVVLSQLEELCTQKVEDLRISAVAS